MSWVPNNWNYISEREHMNARNIRHLLITAALLTGVAAGTAPALADAPAGLNRGDTVNGSVTNNLKGSQEVDYTLIGDGKAVTLSATFSGVSDTFLAPATFLSVWG